MTWDERKKANKKKIRLRNQKFILDYKYEHGCQMCGQRDPTILDLHHPDGATEKRPCDMVSYSIKRLKEEVSKCITLCPNCHRAVHNVDIEANTIWIKANGHKI